MTNMKQKKNKIHIQNPFHYKKIPSAYYLQRWIDLVLKNKNKELTIRIVNEKESAELNSSYRHKAGSTNILSFPFDAPKNIQVPCLGDLVICAPVLAKEAKQQHKVLLAHWAHIVIHGVLHLLGYDHIEESEAVVMEKLEIKLLKQLGYQNPYEQ
jgi:probable rRNA maturation factor